MAITLKCEDVKKKIIITDFDDTLYSWINFFVPAFYAMAEKVSEIINIPMDKLLLEYKKIHKTYKNVEYPYSTLKLPAVQKYFKNRDEEYIKKELNLAFYAFNSYRKHNLNLFIGVKETLSNIKERGIKLVGYTESTEENGVYRVKRLGIEELFDRIYVSKSKYSYKLSEKNKKVFYVESKKPNPKVLEKICMDMDCDVTEAIYIGDSFIKDVYMASKAHICSVWFKQDVNRKLYEMLVEISHWTEDDFIYEKNLNEKCIIEGIRADFEITDYRELERILFNSSLD